LELKEFKLAKCQFDVVIKFGMFLVQARFTRAQALLNMGLKEEARKDLLVAIRFDSSNA